MTKTTPLPASTEPPGGPPVRHRARPRRPTFAARVVIGLVWARLARRRSAAALISTAVGGCILVLGSLLGVGVVTADQATQRALGDLAAPDRLVGVVRVSEDAADTDALNSLVRTAMEGVSPLTEPLIAMSMYLPPRDAVRILAADHASRWVSLAAGRLPVPCTGAGTCEVLRIGSTVFLNGIGEIGTTVTIDGMAFAVVGAATPVPDLPVDVSGVSGMVLLADGVDALHHDPGLANLSRSDYWLAPLAPARTHAWMLDDLSNGVDGIRRDLAGSRTFIVQAPERAIQTVRERAGIAVGRLVFISSLVIGVLLAFAVFAAAVERPDVGQEYRRLRAHGAGRAELLAFIGLEALLPALFGALAGFAGAAITVGAIAANQSEPIGSVIRLALLQPGSIALTTGIAALAAIAVAAGIHPGSGRFIQPRTVAITALPVLLVLGWDRLTRGPIDAASLASQAAGPGTVLLPGFLGLAVILGSLVVLPPLLRRLARATARAPLGIRMATLSIARDPLRPAATLTLLAFSLGSAVLGVAYADTLRQGAADEAAFEAGLDLRVLTYSPDGRFAAEVLPRLAAGDLGTDVGVHPIVRLEGASATGRAFSLTGIEPNVIPALRNWRGDYSATSPRDIADAIAMPGPWILPGHELAPGARELALDVESSGDPIALTAIIKRADGTFLYLELGDLSGGRQTLRQPLLSPDALAALGPDDPVGWHLVGILAGNGGPTASGGPDPGGRQQGDLRILGAPEIADPTTPIHLDVSGLKTRQMIRAAVRTDGLVLPAIVSPDLAADVDGQGELAVTLVSGLQLRIHPVSTARLFPTVTEPDGGLVVVDEGPLLLALTARDPGSGTPNQVLLSTPNDARTGDVARTLSADPYPALVIQSRPAIESSRANDPFAIGIVWGLAVGALAGLVLSVSGVLMGSAAELRDERGDLREIEELGGGPRALRTVVILRAVLLCFMGAIAGIGVGLGLAWLAAATIAVTGDGSAPVPPLALVVPVGPILGLAIGLLAAVAVGVTILARRRFPATLRRSADRR